MAETKTKAKPRQRKAKPKAKARKATRAKPRAATAQRGQRSSGSRAGGSAADAHRASSGHRGGAPQVVEAIEAKAKDAGSAVGTAAGRVGQAAARAKMPLVAGGAALAGAAGGLALARQSHRQGVFAKVRSKDVARAARKAGDVGAQVGEIALEVRRARERSNGGDPHRSPIEVVLQGLTSRGS